MSRKSHGQIRRSQAVTSWGPGSLLDLPEYAVIMGGLEKWPAVSKLEEIQEPRLVRKITSMTGLPDPHLYAPPADTNDPSAEKLGIGVWEFPEWFVVHEDGSGDQPERSRRLVHRTRLDRHKFDGRRVVPTRFVRACPRGHIADVDWFTFVHGGDGCRRQLLLDERGTTGDLADLFVRCECGKSRNLHDATLIDQRLLGTCGGDRPWIGRNAREECSLPSRLLIRTATNAYFSQILSVLSLPDRGSEVQIAVSQLWDEFSIVEDIAELKFLKKKPRVADVIARFDDREVMKAIEERRSGAALDRKVKDVELDALVSAEEGFGEDVPIDPNFHARRLPDHVWRKSNRFDAIEAVTQLHRLREVQALIGFTRFEAVTPDIGGEYDSDVETADLAREPKWFPAVENRGEGIFLQLRASVIDEWLKRDAVSNRVNDLWHGFKLYLKDRSFTKSPEFPGPAYVLLHTLSHLLIQSLSMRSGYPASSIRERIYADTVSRRYGLLLYTASPDAEGTLGGLVQQARHMDLHLSDALRMASLCSNDPICAQHNPNAANEGRWLHGASCHGCTLIAETSCEMRNDYLDRALVVPVIGRPGSAFFGVGE